MEARCGLRSEPVWRDSFVCAEHTGSPLALELHSRYFERLGYFELDILELGKVRRARRIFFILEFDIDDSGVRRGDGGIVLAEVEPGKRIGARLVFPERRRTHELARLVLDNELKAVAALTDRNIVLVAVFRIGGVGRGKVGIHISAGIGSGKLAAYVAGKRGIQRVGNGKVGLLASCDGLGIGFCVDNDDIKVLVCYVLDLDDRR